jgi:hypothetical protein
VSVEECIDALKTYGKEWALADGRINGLTVDHLKNICTHYGMTKSGKKN